MDWEMGDSPARVVARMIAIYDLGMLIDDLHNSRRCGISEVFSIGICEKKPEVIIFIQDFDSLSWEEYTFSYKNFQTILIEADKIYSEKYPDKKEKYKHTFQLLIDSLGCE